MASLAIRGGTPVRDAPWPGRPKRYGAPELDRLREALDQGSLFYAHGSLVRRFEDAFAALYGGAHCVGASSCTGAIHAALGALGVGPGDEVITSPITDMGTLSGILLQGATPVFADLDARTYNVTPASVAACLSPRTRAVLAVHLAGNPADAPGLLEACGRAGVPLVEDCAQSYLAWLGGQLAGTFGAIGCFSLNEFKHISCGDGGMCLTEDVETARRVRMATDKAYSREPGAARYPEFVATNYRMTELQGAVALAQLERLGAICAARERAGAALTDRIAGAPGVRPPGLLPGARSSYWFYMLRVDEDEMGASTDDFAAAVAAEGVPCGAHYIGQCVYTYPALRGRLPGGAQPSCPEAEAILRTCVILPLHEGWTDAEVDDAGEAIRRVAAGLRDVAPA